MDPYRCGVSFYSRLPPYGSFHKIVSLVLAFLFVFSSPSSLLVAHAQTAPSGAGLQTQNRPKIQVTLRTRLRQSKSLAERVDANDRAFRGFPMAARVASHAPECTKLTVEGDRGFESGSLHRRVMCKPDSSIAKLRRRWCTRLACARDNWLSAVDAPFLKAA
jgi:hypothetical protein